MLYAEGLFETFLAVDDEIIFGEPHLRRLYKGARVTSLKVPANKATLKMWMKKALRAHPDYIKKIRLTVTSGESSRWVGIPGKPQVVLIVSPHELPQQPFKLHVSEFKVDQKSVFRIIKTLSYAIHAAALKQAWALGCDDALMLNESNQVAEVTSANIYWVKNGRIYTPPIGSGCLEGVTRNIVLKESKKLGFKVTERNGNLSTLLEADEVFISSSLKLVVGVSHIKIGRRNHKIRTGPVTEAFAAHFKRMVGLQ
jgi:branched-subunit amino acid aminotransferase/4-amino-4-deoxychorismate lyase